MKQPGIATALNEWSRYVEGSVPLGDRVAQKLIGQPEEQAKAMLFLAADDASYITGHTIPVDGGQMALHSGFSAKFASTKVS